ncbi:helix-turn-helix domain-containing protein [Gluconacetobacter tumulicola]|uniref:helix-turn-helix domain-containing protein n=1 Tax=Gluconacetobacter tumulicola TaxID=1017177 RepID=UPI001FE52214|nr:helix-turn-helix transcriptional regulator [Gluconacetobacter tumulicola]
MFIDERPIQCHNAKMAASENGTKISITPGQARAARAFIGWSQDQMAVNSGIPKRTIVRFELGEGAPRAATLSAIRTALETAGVEFIPENGGGAGVRLRKDAPITPPMSVQADPDEAPDLTDAFFDQAEIREGDRVIRSGRDRRANRKDGA